MKTTIDKEFFEKWEDKEVVMHCKTKSEANEFCRILDKNGRRWVNGSPYFLNNWALYKEQTCYEWNEGKYSPYVIYKDLGYTILEFEDYIVDEEKEMRNTLPRIINDVDCVKALVITFNDGTEKRLRKSEYDTWKWDEKNNKLYVYDEKGNTVAIYKLEFIKCVEERLVEKQMKTTIDKEFFEKNNAWFDIMHCKTAEEAYEFCKILHEYGFKWRDGDSYIEMTKWGKYKENTCYMYNEGRYCNYSELLAEGGYAILEFEDCTVAEEKEDKLIILLKDGTERTWQGNVYGSWNFDVEKEKFFIYDKEDVLIAIYDVKEMKGFEER